MDFQQIIDNALADLPHQGSVCSTVVHAIPINEDEDRPKILKMLRARPSKTTDNRVHIGVAGFFNFEMAAITRPEYLLLLDVNPHQAMFWKAVVELLKAQPTPEGFVQEFLQRCEHRPNDAFQMHCFYIGDTPLEIRNSGASHAAYLEQRAPWLADPQAYQYLRHLACAGHIAAATIDLGADTVRAQALRQTLQHEHLVADTCYWSTVYGTLLDIEHAALSKGREMLSHGEQMPRIAATIGGLTSTHFFPAFGLSRHNHDPRLTRCVITQNPQEMKSFISGQTNEIVRSRR